jgi:hypothetical protein
MTEVSISKNLFKAEITTSLTNPCDADRGTVFKSSKQFKTILARCSGQRPPSAPGGRSLTSDQMKE